MVEHTAPEEQASPRGVAQALTESYRELTPLAVILGIFQGAILNLAFVYAALKLGFSIGGSTVASIMGYAILRGIFRKGTSVENNINQTIASGINTAGTGIVFTLPALFLLDAKWRVDGGAGLGFSLLPFLVAGVAGAVLGVVLIIPLRKQMIEMDRLRFPTGVAVTTIIRSGSAGMEKAKLLFWGTMISAAWKGLMLTGWLDRPGLLENEELNLSFGVIPAYWAPVIYLSLMNLAAGMLAGRGGLPFLMGGIVSWWIISPVAVSAGWTHPSLPAAQQAEFVYQSMLRPLGIGALIGGALMGVVLSFPAIRSALRALAKATSTAQAGGSKAGSDEMSFRVLVIGTVAAVALFFWAAWLTPGVGLWQAMIAAVIGTLWLGLAGLIVAQATGMTDISPMSGMALISVTLMMFLLNKNIAAAMLVGVAVCVAIGQAADMMQDLKTGFMLGARPIRQQYAQLCLTWLGSLLAVGALYLLWRNGPNGANGFGPGTDLPAPQASVLMGIVEGLKHGQVPLDKYVMGGVIGAMLGAAPIAGMGVLVGLAMYLPFPITLGYGVGCLTQISLEKRYGADFSENKIVPFAAGLIVGEALMGIANAAFQILKNSLA